MLCDAKVSRDCRARTRCSPVCGCAGTVCNACENGTPRSGMLQLENIKGIRVRTSQNRHKSSLASMFRRGREIFVRAPPQANQLVATRYRNSAEFRAHFSRKYSQSLWLVNFAPEVHRPQTKSGINLALACPNSLQALKLSSVIMRRMRVRDRKD